MKYSNYSLLYSNVHVEALNNSTCLENVRVVNGFQNDLVPADKLLHGEH